jgi:microcystin-dependent protein
MSDPLATDNLQLPYVAAAQAQKHVTHNEALRKLDTLVQLAVLDSTLTEPPASPGAGDRYIVAASGTDDWAGHDGEVATWVDGLWEFATPGEGWLAFDLAAEALLVFLAGTWAPAAAAPSPTDQLGVNTTADTTNRLAVRSEAALFTAIADADGGSGDISVALNKESDADTASVVLQSGWSGRAELGLAGDTDFVVKVSADGSSWVEAIRIDKDTGLAALLYDNAVSGLTATTVQDAIDEVAAGGGGGGGAVVSVFGRTGAVVATAGDYAASDVDNDSGVSGATVKDALDALDSGKQDADSDLGVIAALSPSDDDVMQRKSGGWTNRTPAQLKADLALTKGDVGLGSVTNDAQLKAASNLSDLGSASTARSNLGLGDSATKNTGTTAGTVAVGDDSRITGAAQKASNLSDLASAATARSNLGLGDSATKNTGTTTGTVAAGDDSRITGAAQKASNLSDLANAATAFGNIKQAADTSTTGVVELATVAEAGAGTDTARAVTPAGLFPAQASVASAATCDIGAAASSQVTISGTTTITAFDTVAAGIVREGVFEGALTLTHNATSLKLPGGASITTAANDRFRALSLGSGNWIVLAYQRADGTAVVGGSGAGVPIGTIVPYAGITVPANYLFCYGQNVSRTTYASLFAALRVSATITVTIASPGVVSWTGHPLKVNDPVVFRTTGSLPTGITAGTVYYVISAGFGANSFRISTMVGGSAVNTSGSQSGTHTGVYAPFGDGDGSTTFGVPDLRGRVVAGRDDMGGSSANRLVGTTTGSLDGDVLGKTGGEETHQLTTAELASHTHSVPKDFATGGSPGGAPGGGASAASGSAGSDTAHNTVQPTIILNYIIYAGA